MDFKTTIFQKGNNLGIEVPEAVIDHLGAGKRPPVQVSIKEHTYRSTVGVMNGKYLIPLSKEHRKCIQISGGELVDVRVKLDREPRSVLLPMVLEYKLKNNNSALEFYASLAPSSQKKISLLIESAKTEETLNKRVEKIASDLIKKIKP